MNCPKCDCEMKPAVLNGARIPVYLTNKRKGIFEEEKISAVDCYVCPKCGYIELKAVSPEKFRNC